jgi:hypothetical protein
MGLLQRRFITTRLNNPLQKRQMGTLAFPPRGLREGGWVRVANFSLLMLQLIKRPVSRSESRQQPSRNLPMGVAALVRLIEAPVLFAPQ